MNQPKVKKTPLYSDIGPFFMVPLWLVLATDNAHAVRVFAYLGAKHADRDTGEAFPSHRTIATALNISTATVERALQELKRVTAVEITTRKLPTGQTSNIYRLRTVMPVDPSSPVMTGGSSPMTRGGSSRKRRAVITREEPEPESLNQKDATRPVPNQSHKEPDSAPTMDRPEPETAPDLYPDPLSTPAKSNFTGNDAPEATSSAGTAASAGSSHAGYRDGPLRRTDSPESRHERALRDARRRLTEAGSTFSHAKQRHDLAPAKATEQALAEADAAYRTAAQAVRELDQPPDTPVPKTADAPRPSFVNRVPKTLRRE